MIALGLGDSRVAWGEVRLSRRAMALLLRDAVARAERDRPEVAALVTAYRDRFAEEFPSTVAQLEGLADARVRKGEGWVDAGIGARTEYAVAGHANWRGFDGTGPVLRPGSSDPIGGLTWASEVVPHVALSLAPAYGELGWRASEGYAVASWRRAGIWAGRRALGYGPGVGGGILLSATAPLNAAGVALEPFRLPGALRHLGVLRMETTLAKLDSNGVIDDPWLTATHLSVTPHPRLLLGIHHAAMFAGEGQPPFTFRNFSAMFLHTRAIRVAGREFENQMVSGEIRFRPPVPRLPTVLYLEWGTEDNRSAWWDIPAVVVGAEVPAVPGLPSLAVGAEQTFFAGPCAQCGDDILPSEWYRHYIFQGGWTLENRPLGHPLGGRGREYLAYARADLLDARLRIQGRAFHRVRGATNLFSPEREGREVGGGVRMEYRPGARIEVTVDGRYSTGQRDWDQASSLIGVRYLF